MNIKVNSKVVGKNLKDWRVNFSLLYLLEVILDTYSIYQLFPAFSEGNDDIRS